MALYKLHVKQFSYHVCDNSFNKLFSRSTQMTSSDASEKTTTGIPLFSCYSTDKRNVDWEGDPWELVQKKCDEGIFTDEAFSEGKT